MNDDAEIFVGSGNVFADLGLPNPEERLLKAQLTAQIQAALDERGLTDAQAAEVFEMPLATVEGMLIGRLADIPVTQLFKCLNRLDATWNCGYSRRNAGRRTRARRSLRHDGSPILKMAGRMNAGSHGGGSSSTGQPMEPSFCFS